MGPPIPEDSIRWEKLNARPVPDSGLIHVEYIDQDPDVAVRIANQIATTYATTATGPDKIIFARASVRDVGRALAPQVLGGAIGFVAALCLINFRAKRNESNH
jgi:hypothetical protein